MLAAVSYISLLEDCKRAFSQSALSRRLSVYDILVFCETSLNIQNHRYVASHFLYNPKMNANKI